MNSERLFDLLYIKLSFFQVFSTVRARVDFPDFNTELITAQSCTPANKTIISRPM